MFGLMRPEKKCGKSCHDWTRTHRMHYCGTCKAIGTEYGHQARLFLNFDIVFLSELLSDMNTEKVSEWTTAYQSINRCFSMPTKADKTPFSLEYTATANTILSALKVDDNIKDQKKWRWYATRTFYTRSFRKAFEQMEAWGTAKEAFFYWIDLQEEREGTLLKNEESLLDYLTFYAEPTAELTALIFEKGIEQIKPTYREQFRKLGYYFGLLMYVLDAFEDLENDIFTKQFNPLIDWFSVKKTLNQDQLVDVRHIILQLQHQICEGFKALPLQQKDVYSSRLVSNIALRIYKERYIPTTRKERILFRWEKAKELGEQIICDPTTNYSMLKYYLVTSSIFLMPELVNKMPKREDKIDWEWSAFWSIVLPFSVNAGSSGNTNSNQSTKKEEEEKKKAIACCCCFGSLSIIPLTKCCISSTVKTSVPSRSPSCNSGQSSTCNSCGACNSGDCCCDNSKGDCCCNDDKGVCCCDNIGKCDCCEGGGGGGGCDCCKGSGGGGGCDCCEGGGGGGGCDCCEGGGGGGGCDCCKGGGGGGGCDCCKGGGGGGGCDCCEGGGGGGGCDCCKGGGGGGGCDCCKGGGGGGGCDCCKGGGGGGGCDCCKGGGGGGGCDCCKGGGGGGGCDCCKGGGGGGGCDCCKGGGGGNCCKTDIGGCDTCAPAHLESCNGILECFFPWHC